MYTTGYNLQSTNRLSSYCTVHWTGWTFCLRAGRSGPYISHLVWRTTQTDLSICRLYVSLISQITQDSFIIIIIIMRAPDCMERCRHFSPRRTWSWVRCREDHSSRFGCLTSCCAVPRLSMTITWFSSVSGVVCYKICKFLTEEIMDAQMINFAPKLPEMGDIQSQLFIFFCEKIFRQAKICLPQPRRHCLAWPK